MREQVRGRMAQELVRLAVLLGDDGDVGVRIDAMAQVDQFSVHLSGERGAREPRADRLRDFGYGERCWKRLRRAVGETDIGHRARRPHTSMMNIALSLALSPYDHTRDLQPKGIDLIEQELPIEEMFYRFTRFR